MSEYSSGLNIKLLQAIPNNAKHVLEIGCANGHLGKAYKEKNPGSRWVGIEFNSKAAQIASQYLDEVHILDVDSDALFEISGEEERKFDVIVIDDHLGQARNPERLLERLYDLTNSTGRVVCCLPNMAHSSVVTRLVSGDISYDNSGLLAKAHTRFYSPAAAFKTFLDAGWLPHMSDSYREDQPHDAVMEHLLATAEAMGVPRSTAQRNMGLYQMVITCKKWARQEPAPAVVPQRFSVIVPVNRPWQFELNVKRSPGLAEVGAELLPVVGASTAAQAYEAGAQKASHAWRIMAHQDIYFPAGSGHAIAYQLGLREAAGNHHGLMGFAGLHAEQGLEVGLRHAGFVIDRTAFFNNPTTNRAVSLDELAIILHRDSPLRIDPTLGWHLWATDLCLQALANPAIPPASTLQVPLFHNSVAEYTVPKEFHNSAVTLMRKYGHFNVIPTLCGNITRQ